MKRVWISATIATGIIAGLTFAVLIGSSAWENNSQGEYHDTQTGAIHWDVFGPVIAGTFIVPFVSVVMISGVLYAAVNLCRKYKL